MVMKESSMPTGDILLVDDDPDLLRLIGLRLSSAGYKVRTADSGETALAAIAIARPATVITDLRMPGIDGLQLFEAIHRRHPALPVIILTAHGTIPDAVNATQRGVFGFLTKPFDSQELLQKVGAALAVSGDDAQGADGAGSEWRAGIITRSPKMDDLLRQARLVADSDASVLIYGESGTGKELLARAIHRAGPRSDKPFVAVNCGAIPGDLLESELFGHARGAFTGAVQAHKGLFQTADGGTLFLDEIGDMPLKMQAKLLRVLETGEVVRVGSNEPRKTDVRLVSATNKDIKAMVAAGTFREDLYFRIQGAHIHLPALRERREDIPRIVRHAIARGTPPLRGGSGVRDGVAGYPIPDITDAAMMRLTAYPWPGNVRQLLNVVQNMAVMAGGEDRAPGQPLVLDARHIPDDIRSADDTEPPAEGGMGSLAGASLEQLEKRAIRETLRLTAGNREQAAKMLGIGERTLYRKLKEYGLR
jgi:DNA-binding NtrC family response regulator